MSCSSSSSTSVVICTQRLKTTVTRCWRLDQTNTSSTAGRKFRLWRRSDGHLLANFSRVLYCIVLYTSFNRCAYAVFDRTWSDRSVRMAAWDRLPSVRSTLQKYVCWLCIIHYCSALLISFYFRRYIIRYFLPVYTVIFDAGFSKERPLWWLKVIAELLWIGLSKV